LTHHEEREELEGIVNSCTVSLSVRTYVVDSKELMKIPEIAILLDPNRGDVANTHETLFRASPGFFCHLEEKHSHEASIS
jgi:hypothetical protein